MGEWLHRELQRPPPGRAAQWRDLLHARRGPIVIESWRRFYNTLRPHGSLGYRPPAPEVFIPQSARAAALPRPASPPALAPRPSCTNINPDHSLGADHSLWVLWLIAGDIAFVPLVAVPIVIVVTLLLQVPLARTTRSLQQYASRRQAVLIETLAALEAIKSSNAEGHVQRKWEEALTGAARANSSVRRWSSFALYFTSIVQQAVTILITVWGVTLIYEGRLTIGALIAANILASRILSPLGNIAMTLARGQQAITALVGINSLMQLPRDRPPKLGGSPRVLSPEVEFRKVTFNYPGQDAGAQ